MGIGPRRGWTVVETLVVMGIVALLMALAVPALAGARRAGRDIQCRRNLRDLGVALRMYMDNENGGVLPAVHGYSDGWQSYLEFVDVIKPFLAAPAPTDPNVDLATRLYPYMCPLDHDIGPKQGFSYDYLGGAYMIDWLGSGEIDPSLAQQMTLRYEAGEYSGLIRDIRSWHGGDPGRFRNYLHWDGHVEAKLDPS